MNVQSSTSRKTHFIYLTIFLIVLVVGFTTHTIQARPEAKTIYVNGSNTGSQDGTQAHPYRTIGTAIDNAVNGDTVLVYPGTYPERIQIGFDPLQITLKSLAGPSATIIDGQNLGSVITIYNGNLTIEGFTIQNGGGGSGLASAGYGIVIYPYTDARATIRGNIIKNTHLRGAIGVTTAVGGAHTETLIENNVIVNNTASDPYQGGGIYIDLSDSNSGWSLIRNNVIAHNVSFSGGVKILVCCGVTGFQINLVNNTIVENAGMYGGGLNLNAASTRVANNIIAQNTASAAGNDLYVVQNGLLATFEYNDIGDGQYAGSNGNFAALPLLMDTAHDNYHLSGNSPCINSGTSTNVPSTDFEGDARPTGLGVDIGADELTWPTDTLPPISYATSPSFADPVFTVTWHGVDQGSAGIAYYDLQVKDGLQGSWTNWLTHTHNLQADYSGTIGHTYYFQARAIDQAGHVENFPGGNGDTATFVGPDLTSSQKRVAAPAGDLTAGAILTYTLIVRNTDAVSATAWLTDTLPDVTRYVTGSLTSTAEPASFDADLGLNGTILWHGTVDGMTAISLTFQTELLSANPNDLPVRNTMVIDDGWGHLFTRLVFLPSHDLYLPLVMRNN
jgi:uncharacterized repeat protein (TIGR01451 family)